MNHKIKKISPLDSAYYLSREWKTISRQVVKRDECCQKCSGVIRRQAHHIRYHTTELSDLICLCQRCHLEWHKSRCPWLDWIGLKIAPRNQPMTVGVRKPRQKPAVKEVEEILVQSTGSPLLFLLSKNR